jgi:tetratricopeptide (TPR) repeat protein
MTSTTRGLEWIDGANCFSDVLLGLSTRRTDVSLFSSGCAKFFANHDFNVLGFPYIQVFEPNVLREVLRLRGLSEQAAEDLGPAETAAMCRLHELVGKPDALSDAELTNTIGALISISRFDAARRLKQHLETRSLSAPAEFESAWLDFLISNRCDEGRRSQYSFDRMRAAAEAGSVLPERVLDMCTQGVVWQLKRGELNYDTLRWCLKMGAHLCGHTEIRRPEAAANWYRGLAMLPAARSDPARTRAYMESAEANALRAIERAPEGSLAGLNALKTYYESSIKEFLYVAPDEDRALNAAHLLIEADPLWSLSVAEMGDVYARFGRYTLAAECYERAAALGPPYVGVHLWQAAKAQAKAGNGNAVRAHRDALIELTTDCEAVRLRFRGLGA